MHGLALIAGLLALAGGLSGCSAADGGERGPITPIAGSVSVDSGGVMATGGEGTDGQTGGSPMTGGDLVSGGGATPASGGQPQEGTCGVSRAESQFERPPVDVIWAIDNSPSMITSIPAVSSGLVTFTDSVQSSGADMHVVMVTNFVNLLPQSVMTDVDTYLLRPVDVQSTNAFDVLLADYPNYQAFLRPNAATHFVVVSDFAPLLVTSMGFRTAMEQNLGHGFTFHAITDPLGGADYYALAAATGGIQQPITSDWGTLYDQLEAAVVSTAKLPCDVPLEIAPNADVANVQVIFTPTGGTAQQFPKALQVGRCQQETAWYFDQIDDPKRVILCPASCELVQQAEGELEVVVGCEPPPVLE